MAIRFSGACCCGCLYFKDIYSSRNSDNTAADRVNFIDTTTYQFTSGTYHINFSGSGLFCDSNDATILFYNNASEKKNSVIMTNIVLKQAGDYGSILYGGKEIKLEGGTSEAQIIVDGEVLQELRQITYPYDMKIKVQAMPNTIYPNVNRHLHHKYDSAVLQIWYGGSEGNFGGIGETATCYSTLLDDSEVSVDSYGLKASSGVRFTSVYAYNVPSGFTLANTGWDTGNPLDMDRDGIANTGDNSWNQVGLCSFQPHTPNCYEACFPDKLPDTIQLTIEGYEGQQLGICTSPDNAAYLAAVSGCNQTYSDDHDACDAANGGSCPCDNECTLSTAYTACLCDASTINIVTGFDYTENNGTFILQRLPPATGSNLNACDGCTYEITGVPYTVPVSWASSTTAFGDIGNRTGPICVPPTTRTEQFGTVRSFRVTLAVTYKDLYAGITDTTISCTSTTGLGAFGTLKIRSKSTVCSGGDFCEGSGTLSGTSGGSGTIFCGDTTYGFPCTGLCPGANIIADGSYNIISPVNYVAVCKFEL